MFKNYLDRELSQTRKVSSLRRSLSWINKWLKWSLKKTKSSSSLMLTSTPFLTEFAPLMVLKIYKWKTNLCFFFSGKQIFHKRQKLIKIADKSADGKGMYFGWVGVWFGRRRRQAGKEATYTRSAQPPGKAYAALIRWTELTPGYSYSCKKPSHEAHTQPGAKQLCFWWGCWLLGYFAIADSTLFEFELSNSPPCLNI